MTWGVAIQMVMRYERQKQYMLPVKGGGGTGRREYSENSS